MSIRFFVPTKPRFSDAVALPHDRLVRSRRRCLWALVSLSLFYLVACRFEASVVHAGWSLTLGQGAIQGSFPLRRPLPTTYNLRSAAIVRASGLPIEPWFRFDAGVVFFASIPLWALGVYPAARLAWCMYRLKFRVAVAKCERCGYDLGAARTGVCPECGWKRDWLRTFRRGLLDRF